VRRMPIVAAAALCCAASTPAVAAGVSPASTLTAAQAAELGKNVDRPVIVLMKNAFTGAEVERDQAPVMTMAMTRPRQAHFGRNSVDGTYVLLCGR
jgi:hypothetical protein